MRIALATMAICGAVCSSAALAADWRTELSLGHFSYSCSLLAASPGEPSFEGVDLQNINTEGLDACVKAASQNGALSFDHYHLSRMYRALGRTAEADIELQIAAPGYAFAAFELGTNLVGGEPPYEHAEAARGWLNLASGLVPDAMVNLGYMEWNGYGGPVDKLAAIEHERQAARLGSEIGAQNLALFQHELAAAQNPVDANGQTYGEAVDEVQRLEWERQQELDRQNCQYNRSFGDAAAAWAGC